MKTRKEKVDAILDILNESSKDLKGLRSEIIRLYKHIIKCVYQPERHTDSWDNTINDVYKNIKEVIDQGYYNALLKDFDKIYKRALKEANKETLSKDNIVKVNVVDADNQSDKKVKDIFKFENLYMSDNFLTDFYNSDLSASKLNFGYSGRYRILTK